MEEGKQYNEYSVESNPRAYMTMRDYRKLAWQSQQPLGEIQTHVGLLGNIETNG